MLDDIEPTVRLAIMRILSAVYETGLTDDINISVVLQLFGVTSNDTLPAFVSFEDEGWLEEYHEFKASGQDFPSETHVLSSEDFVAKLAEYAKILSEGGELHMLDNLDELDDLMDDDDSIAEFDDLSVHRKIH